LRDGAGVGRVGKALCTAAQQRRPSGGMAWALHGGGFGNIYAKTCL